MYDLTSGNGGADVETPTDAATDPLADFRISGGITLAEFAAADKVRLGNGTEVSALALAAAGTHNEAGTPIADGVREQFAERIDASARGYAAWLDSRPLIEQVRGQVAPVIFAGPVT